MQPLAQFYILLKLLYKTIYLFLRP